MKKILIILAFTVNIGLTVFGFATLLDSPYTGIRMTVCGDHACIKSVDKGSPADGKIIEGDRLISIEDMVIPHLAFNEDPNYIRSRKDHLIFWEAQRRLSESVIKDKSATFLLERERSLFAVSLTPGSFPLISVLARIIPLYLVGWTFVGVAYLVLKKKHHEIAVVNFLISIFASMSFLSFAPYQFRDLYFSAPAFKLLSAANDIGSQAFSCAALHMVLIFPRRKKVVIVNPWILRLPYVYLLVIFVAHVSAVFDNVQLTTYGVMNVCLLSCFARFLYDYSVEENMLYKKQIQWVIFGMVAGITFWLTMTSIPIMLGLPFISKEISVLPTVIHPLFFAVAVMKYRLMDIESIFDVAVVYGFTIAILAGVETAFLSFASPYLLTAGKGLPAFSVVAVLLIVFIYVPIRNTVKSLVERLFKRGKYDPEKELQQFMVRLGLCDERSALEKFTAFVKGLLRPSGVFVMKIEDKSVLLLHVDNEHARQVGEKSVPNAGEVWG
ncbi:MAG TPA: hypothetical protein VN604_00005, partial [Nitrospirota bacterium]|nr:hypothetical protein [Nitrospirota bacterium]